MNEHAKWLLKSNVQNKEKIGIKLGENFSCIIFPISGFSKPIKIPFQMNQKHHRFQYLTTMNNFNKNQSKTLIFCTLILILLPPPALSNTVCIIGSGIGGASVAHFLRTYSNSTQNIIGEIKIFERNDVVGGRMATVTIAGETFEAGGSVLHPKNYHARNYTKHLNLRATEPKEADESMSLGIWDGHQFVFKTISSNSKLRVVQWLVEWVNSARVFFRYGLSLFRMSSFVEVTVDNFLKYYQSFATRPVFETVEEMLKWAGLYNLTEQTLGVKLVEVGLSPILIQELATVITRINYGQSVNISGLAGAVSLAGSGGGLWAVKGGNWQMAAGLINHSHIDLHLHEEIESISYLGDSYEMNSTEGNSYTCKVAVVATPLDELNINFNPALSIPPRKLQHTHATFVRGLLNPAYFGLNDESDIPECVGTTESHEVKFSSISILKKHEKDVTYKVFSRSPMEDKLLDDIFSVRTETIRIDWAAYPHYEAPEKYAPFILDGKQMYYVNAFENAASTMETSAVSAENIARLVLSRLSTGRDNISLSNLKVNNDLSRTHVDL